MIPFRSLSPAKIIALAIVLCVGQFGTLLHAEQHPFHQASASCDAFFAMENSAMVPTTAPLFAAATPWAQAANSAIAVALFSVRHEPRQSRAPPLRLSA